MTHFRLDVSHQNGTATLWMAADTPCGFRKVLDWPDMDGVREFAEMLLGIYYQRRLERGETGPARGPHPSLN
ncbi:MAG: hypothetical protein PVJ61_01660 [Dehalococcoidia bacterium]|jgi:hypothetical protein